MAWQEPNLTSHVQAMHLSTLLSLQPQVKFHIIRHNAQFKSSSTYNLDSDHEALGLRIVISVTEMLYHFQLFLINLSYIQQLTHS